MLRSLRVLCISMLIALPCFWQIHIPAGDLPSHLYNASLATILQKGPVAGLQLAPIWTNKLSEWIWSHLFGSLTGRWLEASLPAAAAEIFFWGALFWIRRATGIWTWPITPLLAMVTYGVVFHLGFLNFFLSTGLVFWSIGLLWQFSFGGAIAAAGFAAVACLAHPLPVLWAASVLLAVAMLRSIQNTNRKWILIAGVASLAAVRLLLTATFPVRSSWAVEPPLGMMLGMLSTDQVWVFGPKYLVVAVLLSVAVGLWLSAKPAIPFEASGEAFPLWILHGVAFLLLPSAIQLPGYHHAATFLSERISLFGACLLLLCLAQRVPGSRLWAAGLPLAGLFFSFLYVDGAAYNNVEAQVTALARSIPPGQRVVAPIYDRDSRIQPLLHVIDRACLSHCYSYGNYQPATGQFRLQAVGENPLVAWNMADVQAIEDGSYIVPPAQAPIHALCPCESQTGLCVFKKAAGERTCASTLSISPGWW